MNMIDLHLILGGVIEYRSQKESIFVFVPPIPLQETLIVKCRWVLVAGCTCTVARISSA